MQGAPKGNQYAKGNKGGGRKSAYQERRDAAWHEAVFNEDQSIADLERKIRDGKYSGRDMAALRLLKGDKTIIGKFMDKLVPDLHDVTTGGEKLMSAEDLAKALRNV
jgi:hypothetical protein